MRDKKRIERITAKFFILWSQYPDMRFGQFYENLISAYCISRGYDASEKRVHALIWNLEDDTFEDFLRDFKGFQRFSN